MDLKLKVKNIFFKDSPSFQIGTIKMVAISFALIFIGILIFDYITDGGWFEFFNIYSMVYGIILAIFFTSMLYLVCLAIEEDMFETKNVDNLVQRTAILAGVTGVVAFILLFLTDFGILSIISAIAFACVVFLFGQILAISIENEIPINKSIVKKADDIVLFSFLVIFTATLLYTEIIMEGEIFYISIYDIFTALLIGVIFTLPVLLMVYSLAIYCEKDIVEVKPSSRRVMFDDKFSMEIPDGGAGLANFTVEGPIEEAFGEVKQWIGRDVLVKHFSFKSEDIKNQIKNSLMNPQGVEKIPNNKYIVHNDVSRNLFKVFNFNGDRALNLEGSDLKSLIQMMDSAEFMDPDTVKADIVPLKEKSAFLASNPVCDVCNSALDVDESYFVSNKIFYASQKYKDWAKNHYFLTDTDLNKSMAEMEKKDTTEGSAVCEKCIDLFK